ncbi:MAG: hypothetical protein U0L11_10480 [Acutalibacteraceae bacterium]|nr:hypothetical protein [Acutalibacteraceae bacterium]
MFIDEFYYGNIDAQTTKLAQSNVYKKKLELLAETEKILSNNLNGEDKELFEQYADAWAYLNFQSVRDSFKNGFRLGAQCIIDVFAD